MKIKTSELDGAALDWAVAKCEGLDQYFDSEEKCAFDDEGCAYEPSTNWAQGGPIIERELIAIRFICESRWESWWSGWPKSFQVVYGPTPLIAAMRCYVASKLGEEVEVPEEVCNES